MPSSLWRCFPMTPKPLTLFPIRTIPRSLALMPTRYLTLFASLLFAATLQAQNTQAAPDGPGPGQGPGPHKGAHVKIMRREMGKWWQNPDIAQKLQLNEGQIAQLNQVFYDHKLKLIDYGAGMEKEDLKLQRLLDADQPNESQV